MQTKCTAPSRDTRAQAPRVSDEEAPERRLAHLARGHGELAVPAPGVGVAVDPDVVGRIEEGGVDPGIGTDHRLQEGRVAAVAAADPVLAEDPDVAGPGAGFRRHRRDHLVLGIGRTLEDHVDLAGGEAGQRQVEVDVEHRQLAELELQEVEVPAGAERDLVVGDPERPPLRLREMRQHDRRHLGQADRLRRQQPAVAGDDPALGIDQDRVGEAELADRGGDLLELPLRVGAGVARVGNEAADRPVGDG